METAVYSDAKRRLSRIAGQVGGIQKMVDENRYCVDILTQVSALRAALDQLGIVLLTNHIEGCVYGHDEDGKHETYATPDQRMGELKTTLDRFLK